MTRRRGTHQHGRLGPVDLVLVGTSGLRARPGRAALSTLGIAVGITALVAVVAISASSRTDLSERLGRFGNLLTAGSGQTLGGDVASIPATAAAMVERIPSVRTVSAIGVVPGATVRRTSAIPATDSGGIAVVAADDGLATTLGADLAHGRFLDRALDSFPVVVLGASASRLLGVTDTAPGRQVDIDGTLFAVVGILAPVEIAPEIDQTALVGFPSAVAVLGFDGSATRLYVRSDPDQTVAVRGVLARTVNPEHPEAVSVSRASDLLAARLTTRTTLGRLYLGLGAVALLVGGIGIANVMVIAVLERRGEIGLRRALGATRVQIAAQFLVEALALAGLGGLVGVAVGAAATRITVALEHWPYAVPAWTLWGGPVAAVATGVIAGLYPAARAARVSPADALRSS
jgi:putative ABC transport system permease protein